VTARAIAEKKCRWDHKLVMAGLDPAIDPLRKKVACEE
jgi:hypothetical protein